MCMHGQDMRRKPAASFEDITTNFTPNSHVFIGIGRLEIEQRRSASVLGFYDNT